MVKRVCSILLAAATACACACMLIFPLPRTLLSEASFVCFWENGETTTERGGSAASLVTGIADDGTIGLKRGDHVGYTVPSDAFLDALAVVEQDDLLSLLSLNTESLSPVERAALFLTYRDTVFYWDEPFAYTGIRIERHTSGSADCVRLLHGTLPAGYLAETGATRLFVSGNCAFSAAALVGSAVRVLTASAPYIVDHGALYLENAQTRRLVAALPCTELVLGESDYADAGALAACTSLRSVELPYIGAARSGEGAGEFAHLFRIGIDYFVPATLERVLVTGGTLGPTAFYGCGGIREIDACGVDPARIDAQAFAGAEGLELLHTPRRDVVLQGTFTVETAACGCTIYRRQS